MASESFGWFRVVSDGFGWFQVVSDGFGWFAVLVVTVLSFVKKHIFVFESLEHNHIILRFCYVKSRSLEG